MTLLFAIEFDQNVNLGMFSCEVINFNVFHFFHFVVGVAYVDCVVGRIEVVRLAENEATSTPSSV